MKQPVKNGRKLNKQSPKPRLRLPNGKLERKHPKFGTSKLEDDFAMNFLDKLGIDYVRQFEAKEIGRFYDFALYPKNGGVILIEIDGGYFHADPRVVDENKLNPMQKRNRRVDEHKNEWALMHGIPIIRIWEYDIRNNPSAVMKSLRERLHIEKYVQDKKNNKNRRHKNILR